MILEINKFVLVITLILSVKSDITERKIPNKLTFPIVIWGIVSAGIFSGFNGILFSIGGFLVGLAVFLIPFSMGGMGAGDVKLMASVGSLMGWKLTVYSALLTAIAGGIIVIGYTIYKGYFFKMLRNIGVYIYRIILYFAYLASRNNKIFSKFTALNFEQEKLNKEYIPYGVAIAIGSFTVLIGYHFGYPPFI